MAFQYFRLILNGKYLRVTKFEFLFNFRIGGKWMNPFTWKINPQLSKFVYGICQAAIVRQLSPLNWNNFSDIELKVFPCIVWCYVLNYISILNIYIVALMNSSWKEYSQRLA